MKYCSECGATVALRIPDGDHLPRWVCDSCATIHYRNPKLVVGCVPEAADGRLLMCTRAIQPRLGFWTVPAGFMENGETLQQAAARECWEEALARVEIGSLLAIVHVLQAEQVHVFFRARLAVPEFGVGPESLDSRLVAEADIPWPEIAFPSTEFALRRYLEDRSTGNDAHHFVEVNRRLR